MAILKTYNPNLIKEVSIKSIFELEESDFTPWVSQHLDLVAKAAGISAMELIDTESKQNPEADQRRIDILASDEDGNYVVIENQYGTADYHHWGKTAMFYLPPLEDTDKDVIHIWIAEKFDAAAIKAIENLNRKHNYKIYALQATGITVGESFDVSFDLVASPSMVAENATVATQVNKAQKQLSEEQRLNREVLQQVLDAAEVSVKREWCQSHRGVVTTIKSKKCKALGCDVSVSRSTKNVRVQVYTDYDASTTKDDRPEDIAYFNELAAALPDAENNLNTNEKNLQVYYYIAVEDPYHMTAEELAEIKEKYAKMVAAIK